jgi:predicted alpha/beta-fold hydrolase
VLFHGLEGSSSSHYAKALAQVCAQRGWHLAVPHFRGCSGEPNRLLRAYHSGDADELDWILRPAAASASGSCWQWECRWAAMPLRAGPGCSSRRLQSSSRARQ